MGANIKALHLRRSVVQTTQPDRPCRRTIDAREKQRAARRTVLARQAIKLANEIFEAMGAGNIFAVFGEQLPRRYQIAAGNDSRDDRFRHPGPRP